MRGLRKIVACPNATRAAVATAIACRSTCSPNGEQAPVNRAKPKYRGFADYSASRMGCPSMNPKATGRNLASDPPLARPPVKDYSGNCVEINRKYFNQLELNFIFVASGHRWRASDRIVIQLPTSSREKRIKIGVIFDLTGPLAGGGSELQYIGAGVLRLVSQQAGERRFGPRQRDR
jgi:hypothetical protein